MARRRLRRPRIPAEAQAAFRTPAMVGLLTLAAAAGCGDLAGLPPLDEPIVGSVLVTSRAELENLRGIRVVHGDLVVYPSLAETISDLEPLGSLEQVTGSLDVYDAYGLRDLTGLGALRAVGGLRLLHNPDLESLEGLGTLEEIRSYFLLEANPKLTSLAGLTHLRLLNRLRIDGNDGLASLEGLEAAPVFAVAEFERGSLTIEGNPVLTDLSAVAGVEVWRNLHIVDNERLSDLAPLAGAVEIETLELGGPAIEVTAASFARLDSCREVELRDAPTIRGLEFLGGAGIQSLKATRTSLESLEGLSTGTAISRLALVENPSLVSLAGLAVDELDFLDLRDNDALPSLAPLTGISIDRVYILGCNALEDLRGLEALEDMEGPLILERNLSLTSLRGLENLRSAEFCFVRDNPSLCEDLVAEWIAGLDLVQGFDFRGNRACRRRIDGAAPPPRP